MAEGQCYQSLDKILESALPIMVVLGYQVHLHATPKTNYGGGLSGAVEAHCQYTYSVYSKLVYGQSRQEVFSKKRDHQQEPVSRDGDGLQEPVSRDGEGQNESKGCCFFKKWPVSVFEQNYLAFPGSYQKPISITVAVSRTILTYKGI